jgi:hypothetical protein
MRQAELTSTLDILLVFNVGVGHLSTTESSRQVLRPGHEVAGMGWKDVKGSNR